jgi:hypothetical protein
MKNVVIGALSSFAAGRTLKLQVHISQQRVKRAESLPPEPPGSVRANAAEILPPLNLPENVPVAPREKLTVIAI